MIRRSFAFFRAAGLAVTLVTPATLAQSPAPDRPVTEADIIAEERSATPRWTGLWRIRASHPQVLSGSLGVIRAKLPEEWACVTTCQLAGLVLQVEPGLYGGQISAGYATVIAEKRHHDRFLSDVWVGFGVKGVLLRTWDANVTPDDQTLAGIEFSFTVTRVNFSVGTLRRISSGDGGDWVVSGGVGIGF